MMVTWEKIRWRARRAMQTQRLLMGIHTKKQAFRGPNVVQIDIANTCRNQCLACWIRSPLLNGEICADSIHQQQLPYVVVERVIRELAELGTECIYLSGGGDLFTHPRVSDVISLIKSFPIHLTIHANFIASTPTQIRRIIQDGVDDITASVWAATSETYIATHPDKTAKDFQRMTQNLQHIGEIRNQGGAFRIHNVIMNCNFHEFEAMIDYAIAARASSVNFVMVDVIPGKTDSLLLNAEMLEQLQESVRRVASRREVLLNEHGLDLADFDFFMNRVESKDAIRGNYEKDVVGSIPCMTGWIFLRILGDGTVNSCLKSWRYPLGSVHTQTIREMWNSEEQKRFRFNGFCMAEHREYFSRIGNNPGSDIGCLFSCDNIVNSQEVLDILERMPRWRHGLARMMLPFSGLFRRS